jgi:spore maturation protein CgeB
MRAEAMRRLGCEVTIFQTLDVVPKNIWRQRLHRRTGYCLLQSKLRRLIKQAVPKQYYDVIWVDHGLLVGAGALDDIRSYAPIVINYNVDDPTGGRDGRAWFSYLRALPKYDLVVTVRNVTERELKLRGAKKAMRVYFSYDEEVHRPLSLSESDRLKWGSDVLFVGTWMEQRDRFIAGLLEQGIPVSFYGDHWMNAPLWPLIKTAYRGAAIYGEDYAKAVQSAKVNLGFLSRRNRDEHTQRSLEIPAMGGLLCGERTPEHMALYTDGKEAEFWSSVEECAEKCRLLLADDKRRHDMAEAARNRVLALQVGHEAMIARVLAAVGINLSVPSNA